MSGQHKVTQQVNGELQVGMKLSKLSARGQMNPPPSPDPFFLSGLFHDRHAYSRNYFSYPNRKLKGLVKKKTHPTLSMRTLNQKQEKQELQLSKKLYSLTRVPIGKRVLEK